MAHIAADVQRGNVLRMRAYRMTSRGTGEISGDKRSACWAALSVATVAAARFESRFVLMAGRGAVRGIGRGMAAVEFGPVAKKILGLSMADLSHTLDHGGC